MTIIDIKNRIEKALPGSEAHVFDPMGDGQHLQAFVIYDKFEGLPVFKQQKMVMDAIADIFAVVHALGLKTFAPSKWEIERAKYGI